MQCKQLGDELGLGFDAVNSNTFQDQADQKHSYKFGSLTHTDPATRAQAVAHNIECIELGKVLGSKALTVWIGDGSNFAGQQHFTRALERYLESMQGDLRQALPADWQVFIEHKLYRARLLFHRDRRLGHQLLGGDPARARRRAAWSISAIMRPTPISR